MVVWFLALIVLASLSIHCLSFHCSNRLMIKFNRVGSHSSFRFQRFSHSGPRTNFVELLSLKKYVEIQVIADEWISRHLRLAKKRSKTYFPKVILNKSLANIRDFVSKSVPGLDPNPYKLKYSFPSISNDIHDFKSNPVSNSDLLEALKQADSYVSPLRLHVVSVPGVFPPAEVDYFANMPDPSNTDSYSLISLFRFSNITDTQKVVDELRELWSPFEALGRIYVAPEGINAQMTVPTNVVDHFKKACLSYPALGDQIYVNIDHTFSLEDFASKKPFAILDIRSRSQIVADGLLDDPLDCQGDTGIVLTPEEWHRALDDPNAIILDCRNSYESDVGIFKNSIRLNTTFFRETWKVFEGILKDKPKDTLILGYCTGGIRCVKTHAYLAQRMGFTNACRLSGGIIKYTKYLESLAKNNQSNENVSSDVPKLSDEIAHPHLERHVPDSKFLGINYVFDERMGSRVTQDVLAVCESCGEPCDFFTNCENTLCHVRFIQCPSCRIKYSGCCSQHCKITHNKLKMDKVMMQEKAIEERKDHILRREKAARERAHQKAQLKRETILERIGALKESATSISTSTSAISSFAELKEGLNRESYTQKYSHPTSTLLKEVIDESNRQFPGIAQRMITGPHQGQLMALLTKLFHPQVVLELGTFTGYGTLSIAEAMDSYGENSPPSNKQTVIHTCDKDEITTAFAQRFFDKYNGSTKIVLHHQSADQILQWAQKEGIKFDMVYVDADKKCYGNYLKTLIGESKETSLLSKEALLLFDNTLWKDIVIQFDKDSHNMTSIEQPSYDNEKQKKRFEAIGEVMHSFNEELLQYADILHPVMIPMRDGLTAVHYRQPNSTP